MPVFYRYNIPETELILWRITEMEEELSCLVTGNDLASVDGITSVPRRLERLSWRAALRAGGVSCDVGYDRLGAPYLIGSDKYISVSHCPEMACVLISDGRCGVDMECASRDCSKASGRFMAPNEKGFVADFANPACVLWCVKEALYKYSGRDGLDFINDISIDGNYGDGRLSAIVAGERAEVFVLNIDGFIVAVVA